MTLAELEAWMLQHRAWLIEAAYVDGEWTVSMTCHGHDWLYRLPAAEAKPGESPLSAGVDTLIADVHAFERGEIVVANDDAVQWVLVESLEEASPVAAPVTPAPAAPLCRTCKNELVPCGWTCTRCDSAP